MSWKEMPLEKDLAMAPDGYFEASAPNHYAPDSPDTFFRANVAVQPPTSDSANTPPSPITFIKPSRPSRQGTQQSATTSLSQSTHTTQSSPPTSHSKPATHHLKRHSISHPHAAQQHHSTTVSAPPPHLRRERERQLANTPREALIQLAIRGEHDYSEAKSTLTKALLQLEHTKGKLSREQEARRLLEEEKRVQGVKTTKSIIDAQRDAMEAREEVRVARVQLENMQTELNRARDAVRHLEEEKDETDRALVRARTSARQFKERAVLLQAREEGRREGFEEGLRQGREIHAVEAQASGLVQQEATTPVEEVEEREESPPKPAKPPSARPSNARESSRHGTSGGRRSNGARTGSQTPANLTSLEAEAARDSLRAIDERENLRVKMQLSDLGRRLDKEAQHLKESQRDRERLREEKEKIELEKRLLEEERDRKARRVHELEREQEEQRNQEQERRRRDEEVRRRTEEEKEKELRELRREGSRLKREKEEAERRGREELERERERLKRLQEEQAAREQREKDRDNSATIAAAAAAAAATAAVEAATATASVSGANVNDNPPFAPQPQQRLSYLAMPPPPMPNPVVMPQSSTTSAVPPVPTGRAGSAGGAPSFPLVGAGPIPRTGSVGSRQGQRRQSGDSYSSASTMPMEMLQFPTEGERDRARELSVIHEMEDASSTVRGASPSPGDHGPRALPTWMTHPPVDHARAEMEGRRNGGAPRGPNVEGWRSGVANGAPSVGASIYGPNPHQQVSNPDLLTPGYPPSVSRRPSSASTGSGSYNIVIEPPSGPPSSVDRQEIDGTGYFLSPNHAPISLPQTQPTQPRHRSSGLHGTPVLPVRPPIRSPYDFDTSDIPTAPDSPDQGAAVSGGAPLVWGVPPPPGFVPQVLTDNRGVSTPIAGWSSLPGAPGIPGPSGPPVIPRPASRASTDNDPPIWNGPGERPLYGPKGNRLDIKKPGVASGAGGDSATPSTSSAPIYGNPLNRNREPDEPPRPSASTSTPAAPAPAVFPSSPMASTRPVIPGAPGGPPSVFGQGFGGAPWGTSHQRSGSAGGATPGMATSDLPGFGGTVASTTGPRSGFSIYGPPAGVAGSSGTPRFPPTDIMGTPGGFGNYIPATLPNPSSPMMSMPPYSPMMSGAPPVIPGVPGAGPGAGAMYGNPMSTHGIEEDDGFDQATLENTKMNALSAAASVSGTGRGAAAGSSAGPSAASSAGAGRGGAKGKKGKKR